MIAALKEALEEGSQDERGGGGKEKDRKEVQTSSEGVDGSGVVIALRTHIWGGPPQ